ncbi:peroxisome biogenesis protein 5 [Tanacetum coccineum]
MRKVTEALFLNMFNNELFLNMPFAGHLDPVREGHELFRKGLLSEAILALEAEVLKGPNNVEGSPMLMDMASTSGQYRLTNPQRFATDYNHNATYTSADCVPASAHMTALFLCWNFYLRTWCLDIVVANATDAASEGSL